MATALVPLWFGFGLSQPSAPPEKCECGQCPKQKSTSNNPLIIFWNWTTNDAVSFYTFVLAIFTGILGTVAIVQIRYLRRADDATQRTLVLTQRPKLRVRNIVVHHPPNDDSTPHLFTEGCRLQCQFFVANIGGTPATIVEAFAQTFQSPSGLPMQCPYEGMKGNLSAAPITLAAGKSTDFDFTSDEIMDERAKSIGSKDIGHQRLFVMGWIEYRDDIGVVRRTAFCREFKHGPWDEGRFYPISDPDYEYEE